MVEYSLMNSFMGSSLIHIILNFRKFVQCMHVPWHTHMHLWCKHVPWHLHTDTPNIHKRQFKKLSQESDHVVDFFINSWCNHWLYGATSRVFSWELCDSGTVGDDLYGWVNLIQQLYSFLMISVGIKVNQFA